MKDKYSWLYRCFTVSMLAFTISVIASPSNASDSSPVRLTGHVPTKAVADAVLIKKLEADTPVPVTFVLPLRNKKELEALIQRIYDPSDQEHFGKHLTSEEFNQKFAPTQEDYDHLVAYAKSAGLSVTGTHSNRTLLNVSGTSESIEQAFNLSLHHYQKPNGRIFYAPNDNPEVPTSVACIIHGVVGLDNHAKRHTYNRRKEFSENVSISPDPSGPHPSGPGGGYSPNDLVTAYNLSEVSANGSNQIIALFELAGYQASDINTYTSYFGLPPAKLKNILVDGVSNSPIDPEVTLDIELALALAPESQIYIYEGPNSDQGVLDTYNRIATDNLAKQVSTSWGMGEDLSSAQYLEAEYAIFLQMAAHGQTIYAAAGDSGAYDDYDNNSSKAIVVDDPASQPYVVGVGGTRLKVNQNSGAYVSELVWNDGLGNGAGGGGVSGFWPIPAWQTNVSTAFSKNKRNVPDVALNADPATGYAIFYDGQWTIYGGTSCAAPLWAAFTARINQQRLASQNPVLGFANPYLYAIGKGSSFLTNFHDINSGNNLHYSAETGYDNASGWGSFNGANLFATLTSSLPIPSGPKLSPLLNISMTQTNPFIKGKLGTYTIQVTNNGNQATSGAVKVGITLPKGLTFSSLSGSGWTFDTKTLTCTNTSILEPDACYTRITLQVHVLQNAAHSVTPTVVVSGGGTISPNSFSNSTSVK